VINALRHQRFRHFKIFILIGDSIPLWSTPYGIKGLGIGEPMAVGNVVANVINALRHQRFRHRKMRVLIHLPLEWSTPYGIKGLGIILSTISMHNSSMWSTPYGIKGLGMVWWAAAFLKPLVINALRHQRFRHHSSRGKLFCKIRGDQRLTASKV